MQALDASGFAGGAAPLFYDRHVPDFLDVPFHRRYAPFHRRVSRRASGSQGATPT